MPKRDTPQPELWLVVCTSHHRAIGPYPELKLAVQKARALSDAGACAYLPVPFEVDGEYTELNVIDDTPPPSPYTPHGYL